MHTLELLDRKINIALFSSWDRATFRRKLTLPYPRTIEAVEPLYGPCLPKWSLSHADPWSSSAQASSSAKYVAISSVLIFAIVTPLRFSAAIRLSSSAMYSRTCRSTLPMSYRRQRGARSAAFAIGTLLESVYITALGETQIAERPF